MYVKGCCRLSVCFIRTFKRCPVKLSSRKYNTDRRKQELQDRLANRKSSRFDRSKLRLQDQIPVSSSATFYVISTGSPGVGRSILLKTDLDRYLFNCGESTQKIMIDTVMRLGVVYNTFITYNSWDNIGGLIAFMMQNSELSPSQPFLIHGPKNVDAALPLTGMFAESDVPRARIEHRGMEHKQYEDQQLTVEYVELLSNQCVQLSQSSSHQGSRHVNSNTKRMVIDSNLKSAMAYIVKLKDLPPKIDHIKLKNLGIPPGEWVKKLHKFETATLDDGRVLKPEDFFVDEDLGPVIILDCPSLDYLDSLVSNEQLVNIESKYNIAPHMIVHMAPCDVVNHPLYKQFMDRFQSSTTHLMLNENSMGHYSGIRQEQQTVLNHIYPQMFPELYPVYDSKPESQSGNVIQGIYGLQYGLRTTPPYQGFQWDKLYYVDKSVAYDNLKEKAVVDSKKLISSLYDETEVEFWENFSISTIDREYENLKSKLAEAESDTDVSEEYPVLTFLGTGSAMPSSTRNSSCVLVEIRKDEYLMLDCGEGTFLQMLQMYGLKQTEHILSNVKAVFVSHLHYDHHGGLFAISEARERVLRREGRQDKLVVLVPPNYRRWLKSYSKHILSRPAPLQLVPIVADHVSEFAEQILDDVKFSVPKVRHTTASYGLAITHKDGWKLVYSGDCMPSKNLIIDGMNCDILIHEGTFHDSLLTQANATKHSTTSQALEVAEEMNAKFTILTHFSRNTPMIPLFTDKFTDNVGFAFDFMQVRPSQYKFIPLMKPLLDCLYGASQRRRILRKSTKFVRNEY